MGLLDRFFGAPKPPEARPELRVPPMLHPDALRPLLAQKLRICIIDIRKAGQRFTKPIPKAERFELEDASEREAKRLAKHLATRRGEAIYVLVRHSAEDAPPAAQIRQRPTGSIENTSTSTPGLASTCGAPLTLGRPS